MTNETGAAKDVMSEDKSSGHGDLAGKYLTFAISKEFYGIAIGKVKEIIGASNLEIISVPDMPDYARGVTLEGVEAKNAYKSVEWIYNSWLTKVFATRSR